MVFSGRMMSVRRALNAKPSSVDAHSKSADKSARSESKIGGNGGDDARTSMLQQFIRQFKPDRSTRLDRKRKEVSSTRRMSSKSRLRKSFHSGGSKIVDTPITPERSLLDSDSALRVIESVPRIVERNDKDRQKGLRSRRASKSLYEKNSSGVLGGNLNEDGGHSKLKTEFQQMAVEPSDTQIRLEAQTTLMKHPTQSQNRNSILESDCTDNDGPLDHSASQKDVSLCNITSASSSIDSQADRVRSTGSSTIKRANKQSLYARRGEQVYIIKLSGNESGMSANSHHATTKTIAHSLKASTPEPQSPMYSPSSLGGSPSPINHSWSASTPPNPLSKQCSEPLAPTSSSDFRRSLSCKGIAGKSPAKGIIPSKDIALPRDSLTVPRRPANLTKRNDNRGRVGVQQAPPNKCTAQDRFVFAENIASPRIIPRPDLVIESDKRASIISQTSALSSTSSKPSRCRKVRFDKFTAQVETYSRQEYDRSFPVYEQQTPGIEVYLEIMKYKVTEMEVHIDSKCNNNYHLASATRTQRTALVNMLAEFQ